MSAAPTAGERYVLSRVFQVPPPFLCSGTRITPRRVQNLIQANVERFASKTALSSLPSRLTIEATNICNLRCPACYTGRGEVARPRGRLALDMYQRLISELGPVLFGVEFFNWGEPLLAPDLCEMIELTHAAGISTTVSTNLSFHLDEERAERLVSSGLTVLGVAIDGATQEVYEKYRVGGNLSRVLANCRLLAELKRRLRSPLRLVWEFHVFSHNQHEIEQARQMAYEMGMEISVDKGFVLGPDWDTEGQFRFFIQPPGFPEPCDFLWQHAVVNSDGGVAPCSGTFYQEDDVGRLDGSPPEGREGTFSEVWKGQDLRRARGLFWSRDDAGAQGKICHDCPRTVLWDEWKAHLRSGTPGAFRPSVTGDLGEWINFMWSRRQTKSPRERGLIPLRRKTAP